MCLSITVASLAFLPASYANSDPSDVPDSQYVSQLLADAKAQAYQLKEDAWLLESYTRSANVTRETHAASLNSIRDHANSLFRVYTKLEDAKDTAAPWQKTAIHRISPLLKELCDNTTATINYINKNANKIKTLEYRELVESNASLAGDLSDLVSNFVSYGKTKTKFERLTSKLEVN